VIYTGQSLKPFEFGRFVTGSGRFVGDLTPPDTLHVAVLRSLHAHATLRGIDVAGARAQAGVVAVLTGEDLTGVLNAIPSPHLGPGRPVDILHSPTYPLLPRERVCYVGQPIALVVAQELALAEDALEHIQVDYEPLPPVLDPLEAVQEQAPLVHPELGANVIIQARQHGGDLEAAFAQADHIVHQSYDVPRIAPMPLETRGVLAVYEPRQDQLTVWNTTQAPHHVRAYLAELLHRSAASIRVIAPDVGGSFGLKDCFFPEDVLLPYLALRLGRPVQWLEMRHDNFLAYHGRGQHLTVEVAVRRDGVMLGIRADIVADVGAYMLRTTPSPTLNSGRRLTGPYHIPAVDITVRGVVTHKPPVGAYRGTGGPESAMAMERTLDLIAQDLKLDPAEVRQRNFIAPDAFPYRTVTGITYDSGQYAHALERTLALVDYSGWRAKAAHRKPDEPLIGIGLATCLKSSGASGEHRQEEARVQIEPDGQVTVDTGISPHGQGSETTFAQLAADALGVAPAQVHVRHSDTALVPFGFGTSASRGVIVGGSAVYAVLQAARQRLARLAATSLGCTAEDIEFQDGRVFQRQRPETALAFSRLAAMAYDRDLVPRDMETGLDFQGSYTLPESPYTFAAHAVVVEVSLETGAVTIVRYVGVHDCGHIINPKLVEGQLHGGIAQGIGQALIEGVVYNEQGQPLNSSLLDYAVPRATAMPEILLESVMTPSPTNPLGAKGIGSVATVPAPAAVANAVLDALSRVGVRHLDIPLTPEKIWRAQHRHPKTL
jgi:carbon-monoxide dehydrogenase large subunit